MPGTGAVHHIRFVLLCRAYLCEGPKHGQEAEVRNELSHVSPFGRNRSPKTQPREWDPHCVETHSMDELLAPTGLGRITSTRKSNPGDSLLASWAAPRVRSKTSQ